MKIKQKRPVLYKTIYMKFKNMDLIENKMKKKMEFKNKKMGLIRSHNLLV